MLVHDLLEILKDVEPTLEVRLICDHGQHAMACNGAARGHIDEDTYMATDLHPNDVTEDSIPVFLLEAF